MKKLKFSQSFLLLMVFSFISLMIISCQEKSETFEPDTDMSIANYEEKVSITLPKGLENSSSEKIENFLENANNETLLKLENSYKVHSYLQSIDKLELVKNGMTDGVFYSDVDLSKQLSLTEIDNLKTFNVDAVSDQINSRSCVFQYCVRSGSWWCTSFKYVLYFKCGSTWQAACSNSCGPR